MAAKEATWCFHQSTYQMNKETLSCIDQILSTEELDFFIFVEWSVESDLNSVDLNIIAHKMRFLGLFHIEVMQALKWVQIPSSYESFFFFEWFKV